MAEPVETGDEMSEPLPLWQSFLEAGGIVIPWRMATVDGQDTYHPQGVEPRAILFHSPNGHLGAVDPRQSEAEQRQDWDVMTDHLSTPCELDWSSLVPTTMPFAGTGFHGFFDEVPAARDLEG